MRLEGLLQSPRALATEIEAIVGAVWLIPKRSSKQ
jgi:hypothetical protein